MYRLYKLYIGFTGDIYALRVRGSFRFQRSLLYLTVSFHIPVDVLAILPGRARRVCNLTANLDFTHAHPPNVSWGSSVVTLVMTHGCLHGQKRYNSLRIAN